MYLCVNSGQICEVEFMCHVPVILLTFYLSGRTDIKPWSSFTLFGLMKCAVQALLSDIYTLVKT